MLNWLDQAVRGDPAFSFSAAIRSRIERMISSFCEVKFSFALSVNHSLIGAGSRKVRLDLFSGSMVLLFGVVLTLQTYQTPIWRQASIWCQMEKDNEITRTSLRIPKALYEKIEASAKERGLTMHADIISRLETTFEMDSYVPGENINPEPDHVDDLAERVAERVISKLRLRPQSREQFERMELDMAEQAEAYDRAMEEKFGPDWNVDPNHDPNEHWRPDDNDEDDPPIARKNKP